MTYQEIQAQTGRQFTRRSWIASGRGNRVAKVSDTGVGIYRKTGRYRGMIAPLTMMDRVADDWIEVEGQESL